MIEFQNIDKRFGQAQVLRGITYTLAPGRTLGLVGENGAGKSTLMNILGGNLAPDGGEMRLKGKAYCPRDAAEAARHGIAFIHQELNLFPNLTIGENLFLTAFPRVGRLPWISRRALRSQAAARLREVGLQLSPDTLVERLSAGERQLVEIAKALAQDARLIIFDEPTTSLSAREAGTLFALIEQLRARGISLIYISHALGEVLRLCEELLILRDGQIVAAGPTASFTRDRMISLMVGRTLNQVYPDRPRPPSDEVLFRVDGLNHPGIVRNVSFTLHRGEVLGIFGLLGAGRSELARILFGLDPCAQGRLALKDQPLGGLSCRRRIQRGLAFLTENRREEGLCLEASLADNIGLASLRRHARPPLQLLDQNALGTAVRSIRQAVRLTAHAPDTQPAGTLSGGNQQKAVLAKWLLTRPTVLILDEPTRGIDVGARCEVYQLINEQAAQGEGVLLISSEIEELIGLCDRILVMARGEVCDTIPRSEFDRERILRSALHAPASP